MWGTDSEGCLSAAHEGEGPLMAYKGWEDYPSTAMPKRSKYGVRTDAQGKRERTYQSILFASKGEMERYRELRLLEKAGEIWDLELQPRFPLLVPSTSGQAMRALTAMAQGGTFKIGEYRADFAYHDKSGKVVEDFKGVDTPLSKWKRKHVLAQYNITVRIVSW